MRPRLALAAVPAVVCAALLTPVGAAHAQQHDPATPLAVASKINLRGEAHGIAVREMRIVRKNDILTVQADLSNVGRTDRTVFYRFKWLDNLGGPVGDGEAWKQMRVLGLGQQTVKSVAPTSAAIDLRLEMNVELR
ncbi:DUF1425 domain-containing protein [Verminephrobacter aporrectodeae subsp. tuberculatae]|uniref:DUF1425 domain-containing protein n=1 Tax=Verminephrobacter aporrectodeae subsp. tuberculatae TaxID=1110392 RepID=A0ABT3KXP5_9BURK|nr:YcfL family protein [Verminephrobacter aporrectodeae]MCW5258649.1 DUF1425 domain-containing protein [Verminephrobacter aporrectodeae subsp. tuberculatae]MCW5323097.1 DUF1425 domain-containing protein [Verminephrobacter aporrectodeae subsp. tuberculatae]MCW8208586.1 DUF1425 domain-containing protein [Verminephrobacter aporrectodeae subsp. tuberculatae]